MSIRIALAACDIARDVRRAWAVEAAPDLFGVWLVQTRFGRLGCAGRQVSRSFPDEAAARAHVAAALRRRASAPRRIGVAYVRRDDGA